MDKLRNLLMQILTEDLEQITVSGPKKKIAADDEHAVRKIRIRPVSIKGQLVFQEQEYTKKQVFHKNQTKEQTIDALVEMMTQYKQLQATGAGFEVNVLSGKKDNLTIKHKRNKESNGDTKDKKLLTHNREKAYILPKDKPVPFLIDLGVQSKDGKIIAGKYDKFRQINRFLEFIRDVLPQLPKERKITILDFGCGKSYLTFAMYYYLRIMNGLDVEIIGLDLKDTVIEKCNQLRDAYGYDDLHFLVGDIGQYEGKGQVDMVVTLHACDTATDYALAKAVKWDAKVILSVPCCQHEFNGQIEQDLLKPVLKYGLLKERMSALMTDAVRAGLLERAGYDVQVLEFIDMEHTPKNILLRCIKNPHMKPKKQERLDELINFLNVQPTLAQLLDEQ
ncbi:MAG: SAM-dependent methyltransferase [Lachnospiraceae bacterium]|nr:SAM-dependent methyltransferase [Lachnospiraceae bacterium]